jgi:hypothetical protein
MNRSLKLVAIASLLGLSACATGFVSSWKDPAATPLEFHGAKVAAVVIMDDPVSRRSAEDTLAREITARGAQGIAMYTILPNATPSMEAATRTALENAGVLGVVTMRPVRVDKNLKVTPVYQLEPRYSSYWGGYYGHGWNTPYASQIPVGEDLSVKTTVWVETLVYSLKQNKLVWSGTSKTKSPPAVPELVKSLSAQVAAELNKQGLTRR